MACRAGLVYIRLKDQFCRNMNMIIDSGNTFFKIGFFEEDQLVKFEKGLLLPDVLRNIKDAKPRQIIFSSVSISLEEFKSGLELDIPILNLTGTTPLPIEKDYLTPQTLGADRIASAVGANFLFPGENVMVIDLGTCITYDMVDAGAVFQGGIISPGVEMRFKAIHTFTKRLPLLAAQKEPVLVGKSTQQAIESGVMNGILAEMQGIIERYRHIYGTMRVLLCGGDASYFESSLKPPIFVVPELVLIGLNRILTYNVS